MSSTEPQERQLVYDVCHEIGNLIAAIRLQAHLLDEDLGPVGLAKAGLTIEGLGARTSALLSLIRPLLSPAEATTHCEAIEILAGVEDLLRDVGLRNVTLRIEVEDDVPPVPIDRHVLHPLLAFLAAEALEGLGGKGELCLGARRAGDFIELFLADDAAPDPSLDGWESDGRRGRGLALSAAQRLLSGIGGHVAVERDERRTSISLFAKIS